MTTNASGDSVTSTDEERVPYAPLAAEEHDGESVVDEEEDALTGDPLHQGSDNIVAPRRRFHVLRQVLNHNLLSDEKATIAGVHLLQGPAVIKLVKFTLLTYLGIYLTYYTVRLLDWEHDDQFTLDNFWTYEANLVATDIVLFYTVGRLFQQRGVDHLAWILTVIFSGFYASGITNFKWLQHSATLYEMHCTWPWQLWAFASIIVPLVVVVVVRHVWHAYCSGVLLAKLVEFVLCMWFLLVPFLSSPYIHFHHWYIGLLLGMHCNFDRWWSRTTMAWCWGMYINGIAVYGRDPVLTCAYAYFLSVDQRCPYVKCYMDALAHPPTDSAAPTPPPVVQMEPVDWRNCSSNGYHP